MPIYPRKLLHSLIKVLSIPEIVVIHGARQTGKTTLIHLLIDHLKKENPPSNIIYFDLEDFELTDLCNKGVKPVIEHLKAIGCDFTKRIYLLIDEIQYLGNPSSFLKYFFDHWKDTVKLIVSGSSSFNIKSKFKENLVGRTVNFELYGLDFDEFLTFKNATYDCTTSDPIVTGELQKFFQEFVFYGGYPRIVLENSIEIKELLLKQIIDTYLKKDIKDLAHIQDISKFNRLLKILAFGSGKILNVLELSNTASIARSTLEQYLMILENTYIIRLVTPFHKNIRSELTKSPKLYFEDTGLKSVLEKGGFPSILEGDDLETGVFSLLRKSREAERIHFWRTTTKEEIDFVLEEREKLFAYEVKTTAYPKDARILKKFSKHYDNVVPALVGFNFIGEHQQDLVRCLYPWQVVHGIVSDNV